MNEGTNTSGPDATATIRISHASELMADDGDLVVTLARYGSLISTVTEITAGPQAGADEPDVEDHAACGNGGIECLEAAILRHLGQAREHAIMIAAMTGQQMISWTVDRAGIGADRDTVNLIPSPIVGAPVAATPQGWGFVIA